MSSDQMLPRRSSRLALIQNKKLPSPLINLQPEIWRLILKKLKQKEALGLRLVHKDFKMKVDNLYDEWTIRLDENSPYLDKILDLRVKEVYVWRLMKPLPSRPQGVIFKYPDLITKLRIDVNDTTYISGENLHILLQCKNLKSINISFCSESNNVLWQILNPQISFNFPQLQTLDLKLPDDPEQLLDGNFYDRLMTRSIMPNLQSLVVNWTLSEDASQASTCRYASTLLKFLSRHGQTLKHFTYKNEDSVNQDFSYNLTPLDQEALQTYSTLQTLKIFSDWDSSDVLHDFCKKLIQIQSKLSEILLHSYNFEPTISSSFCAKIIANNYETLSKVVIRGLKFETGVTRFDILMFSKCVNLRYLKLVGTSGIEELWNLHTLPQQIETIELYQFLISSEDFLGLLKRCDSLSKIFIGWGGKSDQFGVNFPGLEAVLKHGSLKYINFDSSSINVPKSRSEVAKMNEIYSRLVSGEVTNYFDTNSSLKLKKSTDSNGTPIWI